MDSTPLGRNPVFDSQPEIRPVMSHQDSESAPEGRASGDSGGQESSSASSTLLSMIGWGLGWKR